MYKKKYLKYKLKYLNLKGSANRNKEELDEVYIRREEIENLIRNNNTRLLEITNLLTINEEERNTLLKEIEYIKKDIKLKKEEHDKIIEKEKYLYKELESNSKYIQLPNNIDFLTNDNFFQSFLTIFLPTMKNKINFELSDKLKNKFKLQTAHKRLKQYQQIRKNLCPNKCIKTNKGCDLCKTDLGCNFENCIDLTGPDCGPCINPYPLILQKVAYLYTTAYNTIIPMYNTSKLINTFLRNPDNPDNPIFKQSNIVDKLKIFSYIFRLYLLISVPYKLVTCYSGSGNDWFGILDYYNDPNNKIDGTIFKNKIKEFKSISYLSSVAYKFTNPKLVDVTEHGKTIYIYETQGLIGRIFHSFFAEKNNYENEGIILPNTSYKVMKILKKGDERTLEDIPTIFKNTDESERISLDESKQYNFIWIKLEKIDIEYKLL